MTFENLSQKSWDAPRKTIWRKKFSKSAVQFQKRKNSRKKFSKSAVQFKKILKCELYRKNVRDLGARWRLRISTLFGEFGKAAPQSFFAAILGVSWLWRSCLQLLLNTFYLACWLKLLRSQLATKSITQNDCRADFWEIVFSCSPPPSRSRPTKHANRTLLQMGALLPFHPCAQSGRFLNHLFLFLLYCFFSPPLLFFIDEQYIYTGTWRDLALGRCCEILRSVLQCVAVRSVDFVCSHLEIFASTCVYIHRYAKISRWEHTCVFSSRDLRVPTQVI